jgi:hypothetical protein
VTYATPDAPSADWAETPLGWRHGTPCSVGTFNVATDFGDGEDPEVADIWPADEDTWDIDLAEVVKVNALAVPADRELTYGMVQHKLRLVLIITD